MPIESHVILSVAKNLPSSRLDVERKPSSARLRGRIIYESNPRGVD